MSPFPKLSDFLQGGRVALPGFTAPELHDRAQATIAATRGQFPPPPAPFRYPETDSADATERAKALHSTPTSTPPHAPTPAEVDRANLPDAARTVQQTIDRAHRMWAAPSLEEADRFRLAPAEPTEQEGK